MSKADLLAECIRRADGWVVRQLRMENKTVYPAELVADEDDRRLGEKLLSVILRYPVTIRKTNYGYICEKE